MGRGALGLECILRSAIVLFASSAVTDADVDDPVPRSGDVPSPPGFEGAPHACERQARQARSADASSLSRTIRLSFCPFTTPCSPFKAAEQLIFG